MSGNLLGGCLLVTRFDLSLFDRINLWGAQNR
jgi:hypothetical protein